MINIFIKFYFILHSYSLETTSFSYFVQMIKIQKIFDYNVTFFLVIFFNWKDFKKELRLKFAFKILYCWKKNNEQINELSLGNNFFYSIQDWICFGFFKSIGKHIVKGDIISLNFLHVKLFSFDSYSRI